MISKLVEEKLWLPNALPKKWIVNCKKVGSGEKALVYLGRYLYRGVIREKDLLSITDGKVTFRYQDSDTKRWETRTETGANNYGWCCSMSCRQDFAEPGIMAFCILTAKC